MTSNFKLFANCIPVKGYTQSVIMDLQKNDFILIPNLLYEILELLETQTIVDVKGKYNNELDEGIDSYINYLSTKNLGFYTSEPEKFPNLDLTWESPAYILNTIVQLSDKKPQQDIFLEIFNLGTECLSIIFENFSISQINYIKKELENTPFDSIQFLIQNELDVEYIDTIISLFPTLTHIYLFKCQESTTSVIRNTHIVRTQSHISVIENGISTNFSKHFFATNINLFLESQKHNTYYNRRLYIDANGIIKNASEAQRHFGNINELKASNELIEITRKKEFQKYWHIHKELIDVCKDCEYRFMCVDNRLPINRQGNNGWYHATECSYNPYIAKWNSENGYKTLSECGIYSNENYFQIDNEKLDKQLLEND